MFVAIDTENGQAFGPFETYEIAVTKTAQAMVEFGEWPDADSSIERLAQDLSEASWLIVPLTPGAPSGERP